MVSLTVSRMLTVPIAMLSRVSTGWPKESPTGGLAGEVVDLVRLATCHGREDGAEISRRNRMHLDAVADPEPFVVRVLACLRITRCAEDGIALVEQEFGQIGAVLPPTLRR